jgi:hypothetical protein
MMKSFAVAFLAAVEMATVETATVETASAKMPHAAEFTVHVYVAIAADVRPSGPGFMVAQRTATDLLEPAGVRLVWHGGTARAEALGPNVLQLRFIPTAPAEFCTREQKHALAVSRPFASDGTPILLFDDRISEFTASARDRAPFVLGHIMAHVIGHMLEGISRHSASGLMRACWTPTDVFFMTRAGLPFAEEDRTLIRLGMWRRMNHGIVQSSPSHSSPQNSVQVNPIGAATVRERLPPDRESTPQPERSVGTEHERSLRTRRRN